jgi:hypothetical protein
LEQSELPSPWNHRLVRAAEIGRADYRIFFCTETVRKINVYRTLNKFRVNPQNQSLPS